MTDDSIPQNVSMEDLGDLLIDGARYDEAEDVQTALEMNVDVNAIDYNGRTGETPCPPSAPPVCTTLSYSLPSLSLALLELWVA